jgi:FK506-binding protein 2
MRLSFLTALLASTALAATDQLQIGVTKRAEECSYKTRKGDKIAVHYAGRLKSNGQEFDSSYKRNKPFEFTIGSGVIEGWSQGLVGMCEGEERRLTIPPELGYGSRGAGGSIPPNSWLVFDVKLVSIGRKAPEKDL